MKEKWERRLDLMLEAIESHRKKSKARKGSRSWLWRLALGEGLRTGRGRLEVGRSCESLALIKPDPRCRLVLLSSGAKI